MKRAPVWLFDLDDTLHDASHAAFGPIAEAMTVYIERELALGRREAEALRRHYWDRYGATLLGERIEAMEIAGGALVLAGVGLTNRRKTDR